MTKQKANMKNKRMKQILNELIKDSNRSDHKLAKAVDVSQPTVTRLRNQLEKEEYIQEYTVIPNLEKMGYSIMAIFCIKYKANLKGKVEKMTSDAAIEHSSTVLELKEWEKMQYQFPYSKIMENTPSM
jgi:DNA-binding Lrp family transcriptional regulator